MITNQNILTPTIESLTQEKKSIMEKLADIDRLLEEFEKEKKKLLSKKSFWIFLIFGLIIILGSITVSVVLIMQNGNNLLITFLFTVFPGIGVFLLGQSVRLHKENKERVKEWESSKANKEYEYFVAEKSELKDRLFSINYCLTQKLE